MLTERPDVERIKRKNIIDMAPGFTAQTTVEAADPANNQATLQNIRLWDWRALQDTLRQIQEIRTYYDFPDIDIDRYEINSTTRQVMLAARDRATREWCFSLEF